MRQHKFCLSVLAIAVLLLLGLSGGIGSTESKRLMVVLTTNTEGELNPCG